MRLLLNLVFILCCGIASCLVVEITVDFSKQKNKVMDVLILNVSSVSKIKEPMRCTFTFKSTGLENKNKHCNTMLELTTKDDPLPENLTCDSTSYKFDQKDLPNDLNFNLRNTLEENSKFFVQTIVVHVKPDHKTLANCLTGIMENTSTTPSSNDTGNIVDSCEHTFVNKSMDMLIQKDPTARPIKASVSCNCTVKHTKEVTVSSLEYKLCNTMFELTTTGDQSSKTLTCDSTSHIFDQEDLQNGSNFDLSITPVKSSKPPEPTIKVLVKPDNKTQILATCSKGIPEPVHNKTSCTNSTAPNCNDSVLPTPTSSTPTTATTPPLPTAPSVVISSTQTETTGNILPTPTSSKPTTATTPPLPTAPSVVTSSTQTETTGNNLTTKPPTTTTTTTTPTTTTSVATETETTGDIVIVGAVVGIGIPMLVLISCLYCYIARLHKSKDSDQQLSTQPPSRPPHRQNFLQRTFTLARDRIIQPRPLPRIPSAVNKLTLRRKVIEREVNSGVYDSIRSSLSDVQFNCHNNNNNRITHNYDNVIISKMNKLPSIRNVSQQLSFNSSSSYVYPTDVIMHLDRNDATKPKVVSTVSDLVETDERYMPMLLVNRNDVAAVSQNDDVHIEPQSAKSSDQDVKTLVNDIKQASANYDSFNIYPNNFRIPSDSSYVNLSGINAKPIVADKVQKPKPASKPKPAPKPKPNPKPKYKTVEKSECDAEALHSNDKQTSDYDNLFFYKRSENEDASKDSPNVNCVNYKNTTVN